jgi:DNA-directed RNA polymerase subunit omega
MRDNDSMINPKIEDLLDRVDSKFSLVTLGARRARQINSYFNQLGDGLGNAIPPQVSSVARKPISIAFEEIVADKIVKTDLPDDVYYDAVDGTSYLTGWPTDAEQGETEMFASDDAANADAPVDESAE